MLDDTNLYKKNYQKDLKVLRYVLTYICYKNNYQYTTDINLKTNSGYLGSWYADNILFSAYVKKGDYNHGIIRIWSSNQEELLNIHLLLESFKLDVEIFNFFESVVYNFDYSFDTKKLFNPFRTYHYILGTGVSSSYGAKSWDETIEIMKEKIIENDRISKDEIEIVNKKLFNTNYGIPQIFKDTKKQEYYQCLLECTSSINTYPKIDTTLYKVVTSLERKKVDVLTFNYDDNLEQELKCKKIAYQTLYYGIDKDNDDRIKIYHVHGIFNNSIQQKDTVIFTNLDYIKAYRANSYTKKTLTEFLKNNSIFVGNSITDYEEQKTISENYHAHKTFHFALFCTQYGSKTISDIVKNRITRYFANIGVIALWFDNYDEIGRFIESKINMY